MAVRNAIATPFARVKRSLWTACDEPRNNGDEEYRKSVRQDNDEKPVNIALRAVWAGTGQDTFIFGKPGSLAYTLWKMLAIASLPASAMI